MSSMLTSNSATKKPSSVELTLHIEQEIDINAPIATVWDSVLEMCGPGLSNMEGMSMSLKLEPWPGGRWFRDLGNNTGHLWGHVQVIKPPKLLEIYGPMMMSYAAISHVQYRLTEQGRSTRLTLTHRAMGDILQDHREGMPKGWAKIVDMIKQHAEK